MWHKIGGWQRDSQAEKTPRIHQLYNCSKQGYANEIGYAFLKEVADYVNCSNEFKNEDSDGDDDSDDSSEDSNEEEGDEDGDEEVESYLFYVV